MKLRQVINDNAEMQYAKVFEHQNRIIVKHETNSRNHYDDSTTKTLEFDTVFAYEYWLHNQEWINPKKIRKVSRFINIPTYHESAD